MSDVKKRDAPPPLKIFLRHIEGQLIKWAEWWNITKKPNFLVQYTKMNWIILRDEDNTADKKMGENKRWIMPKIQN